MIELTASVLYVIWLHYNCLQMHVFAVVLDSGTLPEEFSCFISIGHRFPAVCIRTSTERPEASDKGCFILVSWPGLMRKGFSRWLIQRWR